MLNCESRVKPWSNNMQLQIAIMYLIRKILFAIILGSRDCHSERSEESRFTLSKWQQFICDLPLVIWNLWVNWGHPKTMGNDIKVRSSVFRRPILRFLSRFYPVRDWEGLIGLSICAAIVSIISNGVKAGLQTG